MKALVLLGCLGFLSGAREFLIQTEKSCPEILRINEETSEHKKNLLASPWAGSGSFGGTVQSNRYTWVPQVDLSLTSGAWDLSARGKANFGPEIFPGFFSQRVEIYLKGSWRVLEGFDDFRHQTQAWETRRLEIDRERRINRVLLMALEGLFSWEISQVKVKNIRAKWEVLKARKHSLTSDIQDQDPLELLEREVYNQEVQGELQKALQTLYSYEEFLSTLVGGFTPPKEGELSQAWVQISETPRSTLDLEGARASQARNEARENWDFALKGPRVELSIQNQTAGALVPGNSAKSFLETLKAPWEEWGGSLQIYLPLGDFWVHEKSSLGSLGVWQVEQESGRQREALLNEIKQREIAWQSDLARYGEILKIQELVNLKTKAGEIRPWEVQMLQWRIQDLALDLEIQKRQLVQKVMELRGLSESLSSWLHKEVDDENFICNP